MNPEIRYCYCVKCQALTLLQKGILLSNCRIGNFDNKQFVAFVEFVVLKLYEFYDLKNTRDSMNTTNTK
jgi:hypothetical protein